MAISVNENSAGLFTVSFYDENGVALVPDTVDYRLDCLTNQQSILAWTSLPTPASSMSIGILPAQNAIINAANPVEVKVLTVRANYGEPSEFTDEVQYQVRNLYGIP